jgi:Histidine-specific methyltransferase, SAM-dependent
MPTTGTTTATGRGTTTPAGDGDDLRVRHHRVRGFTEELAAVDRDAAAGHRGHVGGARSDRHDRRVRRRWEDMRTEIGAKFTPERVRSELATAGFEVTETWTDPGGDYLLTLARPAVTA